MRIVIVLSITNNLINCSHNRWIQFVDFEANVLLILIPQHFNRII